MDAIKQITECGHSVADVLKRLGVTTPSLYGRMKRYAARPAVAVNDDRSTKIRQLRQELADKTVSVLNPGVRREHASEVSATVHLEPK